MRRSVLFLLLFTLFSFLVIASPIHDSSRERARRSDEMAGKLFPRKGGGGGGHTGGDGGGGSHPASEGDSHAAEGGEGSSGSGESGSGESGSSGSDTESSSPSSPSRGAKANEQTGGSDTTTPRSSSGFYHGGASTAYHAGAISPLGVRPFFIAPFVLWWPLYYGPFGAYYYRLNDTVPAAANNTAHNTTDPILCVCEVYDQCGCDNANSSFTPTDFTYAVVNGTEYAVINGTLSNGTSATSAAGQSMGLYLTKSGTWTSWILFGVITWAFVQAL